MVIDLLLLTTALSVLCWLLIGRIRNWAQRRAVLDVPDRRSPHNRPVPTGGGLAIAGLCLIGLAVAGTCGLVPLDRGLAGYLVAATLIAAIGWADDLRGLSIRLRLAVHVLAAGIFLASCPHWNQIELPWLGACQLGHWGLAITFLWLVGLTNAYNFMDGLDALAGTQAALAAAGWLLLGLLGGQSAISILALLLLAASAGFLAHNWPPARVFMGDVGSTFLGFTLAAIGVLGAAGQPRLAVVAVLLVWPFVFDASITFVRRLLRRENVFTPHQTHLYQRLAATGCPAGKVVLLYGGWALVGLLLGVGFACDPSLGWPIVLIIPALACGLWRLVRHEEALAAKKKPMDDATRVEDFARNQRFVVRVPVGETERERAAQEAGTSTNRHQPVKNVL